MTRSPSHVVSDVSVQIVPTVPHDVLEIVGIATHAALEAATVASEAIVQIDLNARGLSGLNVVRALIVTTVDSDVAIDSMERPASVARAQVVNDSTTDESARAVIEGPATRMVLRMKGGVLVLSSLAMSVALVAVGRTTALADVQTEVMTDSVDAETLIAVARVRTDEGNLEIASSPLRGQT